MNFHQLYDIILCSILKYVIPTFFVSLSFYDERFSVSFPYLTRFALTQKWMDKSNFLSSWVNLEFFYRLTEMHYFSNYHLNTEIILYLEVVSLPPLKPASLVLGSSSPPCSRRCWSYKLMSLPEIFLLKAECAILPFGNHGVQNLLFATFAALDHWLMVNEIVPGFLALRVIVSSDSVSPAEIGWKN